MKKFIIGFAAVVCAITVMGQAYTKGTRIDDSAGGGVVYVGKALINHPVVSSLTDAQLQTNSVWMIKKITTNGVYFAGGDENKYSYKWSDRASTNIVYK